MVAEVLAESLVTLLVVTVPSCGRDRSGGDCVVPAVSSGHRGCRRRGKLRARAESILETRRRSNTGHRVSAWSGESSGKSR
jgi:hypothetical protein